MRTFVHIEQITDTPAPSPVRTTIGTLKMNTPQHEKSPPQSRRPSGTHGNRPGRSWRQRLAFWLLLGIAAFYLLTEHRAHLLENLAWLPFLLILACPLIHLFGHGHHGSHGSHSSQSDMPADERSRSRAELPGQQGQLEENATNQGDQRP